MRGKHKDGPIHWGLSLPDRPLPDQRLASAYDRLPGLSLDDRGVEVEVVLFHLELSLPGYVLGLSALLGVLRTLGWFGLPEFSRLYTGRCDSRG